jgi:DNA polymerase-3 subunit delta
VIVEGLLEKLVKRGPKEFTEQLREYISLLPEYTRLFLLEGTIDKRSAIWKALNSVAAQKPPRIYIKEFALPRENELPGWIQQRVRQYDGLMERQAAGELASFVGADVRLLDQEIRKLATYARDRAITVDDVRVLVPYVQEASVWAMVDAIGARNVRQALATAQQILNDDASKAIYLHIMITRQIRLLLQVADLLALGKAPQEIQATLGLSNFVLGKLLKQAANFTVARLEAAYDHLLEADVAMKSGADQAMTIQLLIVELAGRKAA